MTGTRSHTKRSAAADVWRLMLECSMAQFGRTSEDVLDQLGLSSGDMKALLLLRPDEPRPMGSLAQTLGCDASTITWLVDRLEERGLVERRMLSTDRRVKTVALTPTGVGTKEKLQERLYDPPAELVAMERASLESLRDALTKLASSSHSPWVTRVAEGAEPRRTTA